MKRTQAASGYRAWPVPLMLLAATTLVLTPGCTFLKKITPGVSAEPTHKVKSLKIVSAEKVNQDTAVAVDVVFVFDEQLADTLPDMTARAWFREKPAYLARYPQLLSVVNYELVSRRTVTLDVKSHKTRQTPKAKKARKVVLYANYLLESKAYTLDISEFKYPVVSLEETTVSVREKQD